MGRRPTPLVRTTPTYHFQPAGQLPAAKLFRRRSRDVDRKKRYLRPAGSTSGLFQDDQPIGRRFSRVRDSNLAPGTSRLETLKIDRQTANATQRRIIGLRT